MKDRHLPKVCQVSVGRFHHFHLARQLERFGMLGAIHTGYPRFKLRDEAGIPPQKIRTFPWLTVPYMSLVSRMPGRITDELAWLAAERLDRHVAGNLGDANLLVALSGSGLHCGRAMQERGGVYVCDRGSTHIRSQDELLREEWRRWGFAFPGVDIRFILKEEKEYAQADRITVPSEFVRRSFLERGVPEAKIAKIPYGMRLERFRPVAEPDAGKFTVLFVGQISLRKGFLDLVEAFARLDHPGKELLAIGSVSREVEAILKGRPDAGIRFLGHVPNSELPTYYSRAHVFALPSIEEGLSMVMGEALACGCPVVASTNTGAEDLFADGEEGFIVPIRDPVALAAKLQLLADDPALRERFRAAALERVRQLGGWDEYGDDFRNLFQTLMSDVSPGRSLKT